MPTIRLEDAAEHFGKLGEEQAKAAKKGLLSAAARLTQLVQTSIIPQLIPQPSARGHYKAGWKFGEDSDGAYYENTLPHAVFIEYGVKAGNVKVGKAMIDGLADWVQIKGIASGLNARRVAWAIATSMKLRGIFNGGKGLRVMEKANKQAPDIIKAEVTAEIKKAMR